MPTRMTLLAIAALLMLAAPAAAAPPPVHDEFEVHNPLQDQGEHCGFPILWDINMSVRRTQYFDDSGQLVREVRRIREENTLQNLATGKTLRDGPVRFTRVHRFEGGQRISTTDSGLMLNINDGGERLMDRGTVTFRVLPDGRWDILEAHGMHPAYEALDGNRFIAVMSVFCDVLD